MRNPRKATLWAIFVLLASLIVGGVVLFERAPRFYPYVAFQLVEGLQVSFVQDAKATRSECEATIGRMTRALADSCSTCRVLENRCTEKLDPWQRKILYGQPVDAPVMRVPGGAVAFVTTNPELAFQICQESGRQTSRALSRRAECAAAGVESLALSLASLGKKTTVRLTAQKLFSIVILSALIAFLVCYVIIRSERLHSRFSHDRIGSGPQKFHAVPTPRIGGLALASALAGSIVVIGAVGWLKPDTADGLAMLALAAIPAFAGGFGEDITRHVGVLSRLMLTIAAGVMASLLVGATLDRLDVPGLDTLFQWPIFAIAFTAFAVGGVANAINIIDGYHGLVGGYAVIVLAALAFVSSQVGDSVVLAASLTMMGALLGFLFWNYPKGRIFLGDGGAYLLGFWLAELSVLLVARNPDVSPWFPMLLLAYPVFETFFSIYRRRFLRGKSAGNADALHLHQLIYKRLARVSVGSRDPRDMTRRNSKVARYIWAGTGLFILPSIFLWRSTAALVVLALLFCAAYVWLYLRLIHWRAPAWMISSAKRAKWHPRNIG